MSSSNYVSATLPSRGLLYGTAIPDGVVGIRKPTVEEEIKIQASGDLINTYLNSCVRLPSGMSPMKLTIEDRFSLLIALRVLCFGPEYTYNYKCEACGKFQKDVCDIVADTETKMAEDGFCEPIAIRLPDYGKNVEVRFLRGEDEVVVQRDENKSQGTGIATSLALQLVTIEGEDVSDPKKMSERQKFVRHMTISDRAAWEDAIADVAPGSKMAVRPTCKACGHTHEMGLPIKADFFRPTRRTG